MTTLAIDLTDSNAQSATAIPKLTHREAGKLAQGEYERTLALLEQLLAELTEADWARPTYRTEWTVRDMVAHLAGACAGSSSWREFRRQAIVNPYIKEAAEPVDGINRRQLEDRRGRTPAELVDEFRHAGAKAVRVRSGLPWIVRQLPIPMGSDVGLAPLHYLMDTIYPRDQWMHRVDLCAATDRPFVASAEHDGRIVALVVRELAHNLARTGQDCAVELILKGEAGGDYRFGSDTPRCRIVIDTIDFNLLASGRIDADQAIQRATVDGDRAHAESFLRTAKVLY